MTRLTERISTNLRRERRAAGLTQEQLASKAGVTGATVSRYERGAVEQPRRVELDKIAAALSLSTDDLMGMADDDSAAQPEAEAATYNDLVRQAQKATGNRKVAIGFARAITNWNELGEAERKLLEAALEMLPDAPEGPEDISKTEF